MKHTIAVILGHDGKPVKVQRCFEARKHQRINIVRRREVETAFAVRLYKLLAGTARQ